MRISADQLKSLLNSLVRCAPTALHGARPASRTLRKSLRDGVFGIRKSRIAGAILLAATAGSVAYANPIVNDSNYQTNTLAPNDDGSTATAIPLGFDVNFFGTTYSAAWVNNNGNITFGDSLSEYTPFGLTGSGIPPIIAPFFADVDTSDAGSPVTYGTSTLGGHASFGVDWFNVDYYNSNISHTNRNTFQLILVSRSDTGTGNFDIYFNYGQIQWEAGTASGGDANGRGGTCAAAGYSNGSGDAGTHAQITGSLTCGAFLDGGANALITSTNDGVPGQFLFTVRNGVVVFEVSAPLVTTLGTIRQMNMAISRAHQRVIGLRMDGLTGGAGMAALNDNEVKQAQTDIFGDQHLKLFGAVSGSVGTFLPVTGLRNKFDLVNIDAGIDDTFAAPSDGIQNGRVGAAVGVSFADSSPNHSNPAIGDTKVNTRGGANISLFGGLDVLEHGYVDLTGTYSIFNYRMNRYYSTDAFHGRTSTRQADVALRGGYDFPLMPPPDSSLISSVSAGPFGAVEYIDGRIDHFTEKSSTTPGVSLMYPHADYRSWMTELGGRLNLASATMQTDNPFGLTLSAAWQHQYADHAGVPIVPTADTLLTALAPFSVPKDDVAHIGARLWTMAMDNRMIVSLQYDGLLGGRDVRANSLMLQAKYVLQ